MDQQTSQQRKDASRTANAIERQSALYFSNAAYKAMVDGTVYFTQTEQEASQRIIGGVYAKNGQLIGL